MGNCKTVNRKDNLSLQTDFVISGLQGDKYTLANINVRKKSGTKVFSEAAARNTKYATVNCKGIQLEENMVMPIGEQDNSEDDE